MDDTFFRDMLQRFREGRATAEEEAFIRAYYDMFELQPDVVELLTETERLRLKSNILAGVDAQVAAAEASRQKPVMRKTTWLKIAAAAVLLAGAGTAGVFWLRRDAPAPAVVQQQETPAPAAGNNFIQLPDGSTAILSAGSRLQYPPSFAGQAQREVRLEGKAYFNVQHHAKQPFIVHTGSLQTTVLGTSFEINAPAGTKDITVTVIRGRVKVNHGRETLGILSANEQMVYDSQSRGHRQVHLNEAPQAGWQAADLFLDDVTVQQAARLLEEKFNVTIRITDETLKQQRFTVTFSAQESLEQMLRSICAFNNAGYRISREDKTVTLFLR